MSGHPLNLGLRFLLEIAASVALGYWGWRQAVGPGRYLPGILVPLAAAALWGTLRVPGETSAAGDAPVAVPGIVRLTRELAFLGFAVWGLISEGARVAGMAMAALVVFHYALSVDHIRWLLRQ